MKKSDSAKASTNIKIYIRPEDVPTRLDKDISRCHTRTPHEH